MPDKMYCTIVLRKEVADRDEGRALYDLVKAKLADRPDVNIQGSASNHFVDEPS